ncbi:putative poly(glycerol-phosphate) alpha-glucosyltransferase [Indibacter alkaliphilus LW1]|uniref:Poly(Glycerol-phosphate) alpha-glucosyltransferase n=1 Tax=Indibacter alkaliphilus (strain CCUG 57479 / KCTC 22604 / LW1) TaxID=1189612 RepID=S2D4A7_INDAL|nr:glycosyltransferase [Indibacter alkaliphilus]EOZ93764.1 putative poly(glycerol-phosphate) alpha-glucosyltransferase [Indibacter alkaliphilus LW1]
MRLLYLLNSLTALGGISNITNRKLEWLITEKGYEIAVIVKKLHTDYEEGFNGKLKIYNFNQTYLGLSFYEKVIYGIHFRNFIKKIMIEFKPDICISLLSSIDFFILPFIAVKIPKILEIHASSIEIVQKSFPLKKLFYARYSKIIVLNELEKSQYGLNNVEVIPNFISPNNLKLEDLTKRNIIISGGRNEQLKQFDHQISAWNKIHSEFKDWEYHLYIQGNSQDLNRYRSLVDQGCTSLKIFPAVNNFREKLLESSIMVLTSKSESFSLMILEAFNAYNAIISYKTFSGPLTLLGEGEGVLVDMNDIGQLSESISSVIKNKYLREKLSKKAKEKVLNHSTPSIMEKWVNLFNRVLDEGN